MHALFGLPPPCPSSTQMLVTSESVASLAVQVRFCLLPCAFQTSWIQLPCADAGWAAKSRPPTAKTPTTMGISPVNKCLNFVLRSILFSPFVLVASGFWLFRKLGNQAPCYCHFPTSSFYPSEGNRFCCWLVCYVWERYFKCYPY